MKSVRLPTFDAAVIRAASSSLQKYKTNMQGAILISFLLLYLNTVSGCGLFGGFDMPSLFKQGDIMIGGIFPVFNKEISSTSTFEREPPGVKCEG